ncbi:hypothetical protein ACRAWG_02820 [Methylobacterium sp. P31]
MSTPTQHSTPGDLAKSDLMGIPDGSIIFERGGVMALDIFQAGRLLGSIIRASGGVVYAYDAAGLPVGTFDDTEAATAALARKAAT